MEKINSEILISSLFILGFDKVDTIIYTLLLEKILEDNYHNHMFVFEEKGFTKSFNSLINYDGTVFSLKNGINIDTSVIGTKTEPLSVREALHTNEKLLVYLNNIDFGEIVIKKVNIIGYKKMAELNYLFSNKEKEFITRIYNYKPNTSNAKQRKLKKKII